MDTRMDAQIAVVLGAQWGDEGKGKLVDILSDDYKYIVRSGGGANAGHTIWRDGKKYVFHMLPSGLLSLENIGVIGNGCVVDLIQLKEEIEELKASGVDVINRIYISDRAHLLFPFHQQADAIIEKQKGKDSVGTTKKGIGPAYTDKIARCGIRAGLLKEDFSLFSEKLTQAVDRYTSQYGVTIDVESLISQYKILKDIFLDQIVNTSVLLDTARKNGEKILIEGAQAILLDIDHGTYPYVTTSTTTISGSSGGTGLAPRYFEEVIGVVKAYCTRVGSGPFMSEADDFNQEYLRNRGGEFGATTGRPRRCGWLDLIALREGVRINGFTGWNVTKLDVLSELEEIPMVVGYTLDGVSIESIPSEVSAQEKIVPEYKYFKGWKSDISQCRRFEDLPVQAQEYLQFIEDQTGVTVTSIGVGPGNKDLIIR